MNKSKTDFAELRIVAYGLTAGGCEISMEGTPDGVKALMTAVFASVAAYCEMSRMELLGQLTGALACFDKELDRFVNEKEEDCNE